MSSDKETIQLQPIDAYGDGGFRIAGERHDGPVIIHAGKVHSWNVTIDDIKDLKSSDLEDLLKADIKPDIVVLGVGARMRHPSADIRKAFRQAGIGLEVLDTASACRVYNLIGADARHVAAALLDI